MHRYTAEELEYLKLTIPGHTNDEITALFNAEFGSNVSASSIRAARKNHHMQPSGVDTRFRKGNVPANKGTKGLTGPNNTSFKKGQKPHNYLPIGTQKIKCDGYCWTKVADPNIWRQTHTILWEKENGPIPKGYCLLFKNRNRQDIRIDNLILISRSELATLNKKRLITNDPDINTASVGIVRLRQMLKRKEERRA